MAVDMSEIVRKCDEMIRRKRAEEPRLIALIEAEQKRRAKEWNSKRMLIYQCGGCGRQSDRQAFCLECNRKYAKKWVGI